MDRIKNERDLKKPIWSIHLDQIGFLSQLTKEAEKRRNQNLKVNEIKLVF